MSTLEAETRDGFDESEHPRTPDGKFGDKAGGFPPLARGSVASTKVYNELREASPDPEGLDTDPAIRSYVKVGYQQVNGGLRGTKAMTPEVRKMIKAMDQAFDRHATTLDRDLAVMRGSGLPPGVDYEPGSFVVEPGFTSTSLDPDITEGWFDPEDFDSEVPEDSDWLFEIKVPAGTRVLVPKNPDEREAILPRNSKFRVVSKDPESGTIRMELVP